NAHFSSPGFRIHTRMEWLGIVFPYSHRSSVCDSVGCVSTYVRLFLYISQRWARQTGSASNAQWISVPGGSCLMSCERIGVGERTAENGYSSTPCGTAA